MGQLIALCIAFLQAVAGIEAPHVQTIRYVANMPPAHHDVFVVAHEDDWQLFMGDIADACCHWSLCLGLCSSQVFDDDCAQSHYSTMRGR